MPTPRFPQTSGSVEFCRSTSVLQLLTKSMSVKFIKICMALLGWSTLTPIQTSVAAHLPLDTPQLFATPVSSSPIDVLAQTSPPDIPPGTLEPNRPELDPLPDTLPAPEPTPTLNVSPPEGEKLIPAPTATVMVERIEILGNTVFSPEELAPAIATFEGREVTFEQLLAIRTAITDLYVAKGYVTSGAFLPPQDVTDGVIEIQAVEGMLERIEIKGLKRLRESYVRDRLALATGVPINIHRLEQALQLLQLDPQLSSVQAQLKAGTTAGRSILTVNLTESFPIATALGVENYDSPTVGSIRYSAAVSHGNFLGLGDRLSAEYGRTAGVNDYDFSYELPVNARNGTLSLRYTQSRSNIIEDPFDELDIKSRTQSVSIGFRQPIVQSSTHEFALGLSLDWRQSRTFLLDEIPFSFSEGPEKGESKVTALRLTQDWVSRSPNRVLAARSQFSLGLDVLGATVNESSPDGRFVSWLGQFQWVQGLGRNVTAIARLATQLTPNALLPLEQFSIGGIETVRGYRQNLRVGDNGMIGSLELRVPIFRDSDGLGTLQVAPFFDLGTVWNESDRIPFPNTLVSTGLGLRWQHEHFSARLDWGIPLSNVSDRGNSLQDRGVVFSFQLHPF